MHRSELRGACARVAVVAVISHLLMKEGNNWSLKLVVSMVFLFCNNYGYAFLRTAFPTLLVVLISCPQDANLRGSFLLKLSTASTTASDAVKLCLVVLQAELLSFCAVHTEAHADVAASWCRALADAAISLDGDASWKRASRAVSGVIVSLIAEFRGKVMNCYLVSFWCVCVLFF